MMNMLHKVIKYTGKYGPLILFLPTVLFLSNKKSALIYYVTGFFLNSIANVCLKLLIQQPRPSEDKAKFDLALERGKQFLYIPYDVFGMPSGHSQSVAFTTVFVFLAIWMRTTPCASTSPICPRPPTRGSKSYSNATASLASNH